MKTYSVTMLILLLAVVVFAGAGKVDFSGEWLHNAEKSDYSEWGTTNKITIKQDKKQITFIREVASNMGDYTDQETITLDGEKCDSENERVRRTSVAAWSEDGKTLNIKSDVYVLAFDIEVTAETNINLAEEGKVMLVDYSIDTPEGIMELKLHFDKQQ